MSPILQMIRRGRVCHDEGDYYRDDGMYDEGYYYEDKGYYYYYEDESVKEKSRQYYLSGICLGNRNG